MASQLFENFKMYYPSLAKKTVRYEEVGSFELLAELDDGDILSYDDLYNSYRLLPKDSSNLTEEECLREFGIRLRKLMIRKGVSQEELSDRTGITQAMLSRYITGKASPSFYRIDKIAKALGCSIDEFRYTH